MNIENEELFNGLLRGVTDLYSAVSSTFGPKGKNVILFNTEGTPYLTKDGVSVAKQVCSTNIVENAGISIVREAASKTAELAGDGTTTSTILAYSLFSSGIELLKSESINVNQLKRDMYKGLNTVISKLTEHSIAISSSFDKLKYIATTSANNDSEIGELVAEAYENAGLQGSVLFELEDNPSTYVEHISGSQFNVGFYSRDFITNKKKGIASYDKAYFLVINGTVQSLAQVKEVISRLSEKGFPIVIVAQNFTDKAIRSFSINNYQGNTKILPIKVTGYTENKTEQLEDIAAATNAKVFSDNIQTITFDIDTIGFCEKIVSTTSNTTIIRSEAIDQSQFLKRVDTLKGQVETNPTDANKRALSRFLGKVSIIHVGGSTEVEAREKYDRVEDAVCATKAALEEGISEGGGLTFLRIYNELNHDNLSEGEALVYNALLTPFIILCKNSDVDLDMLKNIKNTNYKDGYNFLTDKIENLFESGVIDPTKVLRVSLENAVSVSSLLLTTSCLVTDGKNV